MPRYERCPDCGLVAPMADPSTPDRCPRCMKRRRRVRMEQLVIRLSSQSDRYRLGSSGSR
jgi:hypothetical protein